MGVKEFYADFIKDDLWLIEESQWSQETQSVKETHFSLGNGLLGSRGVLEEIPYDATPGTYLAGVYDNIGSQVDELVNLPNPVNFKFTIAGEKLDMAAADVIEHKRTLNMKKALLIRHTLYKDTKKRRYDYQSVRFISLHNRNIGAMQIALTSLDRDCWIDVNTGIDTSVSNAGILSEGRKKHFRSRELGQFRNAGYLEIETLEKKHIIVYWSGFYYNIGARKIFAKDNIFRLKLKKGQTVVFTKIFYIKPFRYTQKHALHKKETFRVFNKAFTSKFSTLIDQHNEAWEKLWKRADIFIEGSKNMQENLRFNIYHMLICAHSDNGASSIGARTLSGEGYRGHIFWDAEIFLLPFYLFTFPRVAKNMLLYRYKRLAKAKELAEAEGYKGAKFAWESADTGEEETPEWSRDFDKTVIKIHTHEQEHHITADIAYAVYKYYIATGDSDFMKQYGYEMIFECARFWASRVECDKRKKKCNIKNIIGPDEFHRNVNNNAFTNMMAKWNLLVAYKLFLEIRKNVSLSKKLKEKLNLKKEEVSEWKKIASQIKINMNKKSVIEQFDGYFKLKKVSLTQTDENGIPVIPPTLKAKSISNTVLIKQADVIMMLCLLGDYFNLNTKIANYDFYINRTVHKSSLSPSTHVLIASEVGDLSRAYSLFKISLRTDITDVYGNSDEGMHAACLGGTWQALVFGFAGVKIKNRNLALSPHLPRAWKRVIFSLMWHGDNIKFELTNDLIKVKAQSKQSRQIHLRVFDRAVSIKTNKNYAFKKHILTTKKGEFY